MVWPAVFWSKETIDLMTKKAVRCAIYTRKSAEEGLEQEYNSLDAQRDACRSYIESQKAEGWVIHPGAFDDGGVSGGTMDRPALNKLLVLVEKGEVNVIVVYKIDRLTRSLPDFARIVEILDKQNASFVSVTQQFNSTTSMGRLTLNVLLSFAQFEREVTSERIRDKIAASKKKGIWMGGYPPLGYDINNRRLIANSAEAQTVQRIFQLALETPSLTDLERRLAKESFRAKAWLSQGGRPSGGGPLTRSALARMLRNPVYIGKIRHGDKEYDGEQSAIIDEALWTKVQSALDGRAQDRTSRINTTFEAPLRNLVFDDRGNRMVATYVKKKNRIAYRYYASAPTIRGHKEKAGTISRINAAWLENKIEKTIEGPNAIARIQRIELHPREIIVETHKPDGDVDQLRIPAALETPKHSRKVFASGGRHHQNEGLIKAVTQAYGWRKSLEAGRYPTVKDLAKEKGLSERYVWKILRLAYLSPTIVEAILDGRQPPALSLRQINETQLSPDWRLQSHALGFDVAR